MTYEEKSAIVIEQLTNEEAIEQIKILKAFTGYDKDNPIIIKLHEALDMAIKALGKDIPKDPIQPKDKVRYGMGYSYYDYHCPTCEDYQFPEPKGNGMKEEGHITRCYNCGQLIKWEMKADDE